MLVPCFTVVFALNFVTIDNPICFKYNKELCSMSIKTN